MHDTVGRALRQLSGWILLCATAQALSAQSKALRGAVEGVVTDTSLAPLQDASAGIIGSALEVRTDPKGRFLIVGLRPGEYPIIIRRLGYSPVSTIVGIREADTLRLAFMLVATPVLLEKVSVKASPEPSLTEFEYRRRVGFGQFMTESDIKKRDFTFTSDLLRTFQSVAVGKGGVLNTRGFGIKGCPLRLFVDGAPVTPHDLDFELPLPDQLAGIEVYANSATVPAQYATLGGVGQRPGAGACGVILLWSKR